MYAEGMGCGRRWVMWVLYLLFFKFTIMAAKACVHMAPTGLWSRQSLSPSPDRESSASHDGERTGCKSLVILCRTVEPGVPLSAPGESRHRCKYKNEMLDPTDQAD